MAPYRRSAVRLGQGQKRPRLHWLRLGSPIRHAFGGAAVQAWQPGQTAPTDLAPGPSKFDGVEIQPDGQIVITSWNDSSVSTVDGSKLVRHIKLSIPLADVSMDTKRQRVGIVSMMTDQFQLWAWPRR